MNKYAFPALLTLALMSTAASAQVLSPSPDWIPNGSYFVQTSPPSTSLDGLALSDLQIRFNQPPVQMKKGLNAVNVKQAFVTGNVLMGDGSVRKLDGLADASFTIDYLDTVNNTDEFSLECDVVEYKDGEDGTMHTRPGNHKPGKMTVTKDWSNTSEWRTTSFFDIFLDLSLDGCSTFTQFQDSVHMNLQTVPEPVSMLFVGAGALAVARRKRRS